MRKEGGGRGKEMAPKAAKPAVLSAEAAAMEQKLVELRKAMEKERAKREALMANTSGGSIWRNGAATNGLRTNVKGKGPGEGSPPSAAGGSGGASSSRRPASVEAPAAASGSSSGGGRASSARSAGAAAAESEMPLLSGSRLATSGRAANAAAAEPKGTGGLGGRGAAASSSGGVGGGAAVGGMSCGTDDNSTLADGAFNEADSHKSFLEALNEWRKANRGDTPADAGAAASSASGGPQQQRPRSANPLQAPVASASLEVQTDSRPASRPSSAKPLSYFDKLVINASSRVAGHLAAGGPPESLRGSLSGQATGLPRPPSALRPLSANAAAPAGAAAAKPPPARDAVPGATGSSPPVTSDPEPATSGGGGAPDPLSILDRLEALERQRQAAGEEEDEEPHGGVLAALIQVTTATGVVLTKGTRLPDEVLMPPNEGC